MLRLWNRKGKVVKNWRSRAWSIDLHKTKLIITVEDSQPLQNVPPWMREKCIFTQIA